MTIEQRLAEIIQAFGADALSSAVNLNGDLDVVLCVLAQALTAAFRARLPGNYAHATPDTPARSSATATASPSRSTAAPTHQSSATPASPTTPPSPGGADASSASSSPDPRAEVPVRKSALSVSAAHVSDRVANSAPAVSLWAAESRSSSSSRWVS